MIYKADTGWYPFIDLRPGKFNPNMPTSVTDTVWVKPRECDLLIKRKSHLLVQNNNSSTFERPNSIVNDPGVHDFITCNIENGPLLKFGENLGIVIADAQSKNRFKRIPIESKTLKETVHHQVINILLQPGSVIILPDFKVSANFSKPVNRAISLSGFAELRNRLVRTIAMLQMQKTLSKKGNSTAEPPILFIHPEPFSTITNKCTCRGCLIINRKRYAHCSDCGEITLDRDGGATEGIRGNWCSFAVKYIGLMPVRHTKLQVEPKLISTVKRKLDDSKDSQTEGKKRPLDDNATSKKKKKDGDDSNKKSKNATSDSSNKSSSSKNCASLSKTKVKVQSSTGIGIGDDRFNLRIVTMTSDCQNQVVSESSKSNKINHLLMIQPITIVISAILYPLFFIFPYSLLQLLLFLSHIQSLLSRKLAVLFTRLPISALYHGIVLSHIRGIGIT